jgi:hypothetical protein
MKGFIEVGDFVKKQAHYLGETKKIWRVASTRGAHMLNLEHVICDSVEKTTISRNNVVLVSKGYSTFEPPKQGETNMANEKTLYEINRGDIKSYGYKLAVNSQGQWVMEIKGSGDVIAVDKASVSEVIPYTIGVKFATNGTIYHYFNEAKDLVKGDALVMEGYAGSNYQIAMVVDVDTKSKNATKEINYLKKI